MCGVSCALDQGITFWTTEDAHLPRRGRRSAERYGTNTPPCRGGRSVIPVRRWLCLGRGNYDSWAANFPSNVSICNHPRASQIFPLRKQWAGGWWSEGTRLKYWMKCSEAARGPLFLGKICAALDFFGSFFIKEKRTNRIQWFKRKDSLPGMRQSRAPT